MKLVEMIFKGEKPQPVKLSKESIEAIQKEKGQYVLVKDQNGNIRILKSKAD